MHPTLCLRADIVRRLLTAVGLAAGSAAAACGGHVVVDGTGAGGEGGEGGVGGAGGEGGGAIASASTQASTAASTQASTTSTGTTGPTTYECFEKYFPEPCPSTESAGAYYNCYGGNNYSSFESGPVEQEGRCCYEVVFAGYCGEGRPYVDGQKAVVAPRAGDARGWADGGAPPLLEGLTPEARRLLSEAWAQSGLLEHASVASFGRFALELLALGAPADLVRAAHEAALDEIRHAEICFALASAYAGRPVQPGPFPFGGAAPVSSDLADFAARAALEGCVGETLAALEAAERLEAAEDPAARRALEAIALDEARHAELAWKTLRWALAQGDGRVGAALEAAFARAARELLEPEIQRPEPEMFPALVADLARHGVAGPRERRASARAAVRDLVLPCARALGLSSGAARRAEPTLSA